ncbi:MAG: cation:proton antiporter [Gammaproteobacteria bacterium]
MESILLAIHPSDPLWIAIAFACGLAVRSIGLPPLVGFLAAGFVLHAAGAEGGGFLAGMADLGVTLLLFSIGLKLKLSALARPEIWGVAALHMVLISVGLAALLLGLAALGLPLFVDLEPATALLVAFALSFSSTVFAVKVLAEMGAESSRHGRIAIGVLVVQDIAAVCFLAVSAGKIPSYWAVALLLLLPLRPLLMRLLERSGHGELLALYGIVLALGGADLFELVGLKGDLGALVLGMLLAGHAKANELARGLLAFKDLFLVGFFLSIGMSGLPGWPELLAAALLVAFLPVKVGLFYWLFTRFRLRARTAWQGSLDLANYSEFGLIVGVTAVGAGWLQSDWLVVFALTLALSFMGAAPLATRGDVFYTRWRGRFKRWEQARRLPGDEALDTSGLDVAVFGMGRVGTAAYDTVAQQFPHRVLGVDIDTAAVEKHLNAGRQVVTGDATNPDFWSRAEGLAGHLDWVLLTMPAHHANLAAAQRLRERGFAGKIAATTKYPDEAEELERAGVDLTFNIYAEAGLGFANSLQQHLSGELPQNAG